MNSIYSLRHSILASGLGNIYEFSVLGKVN
jgi:hypothetical protein